MSFSLRRAGRMYWQWESAWQCWWEVTQLVRVMIAPEIMSPCFVSSSTSWFIDQRCCCWHCPPVLTSHNTFQLFTTNFNIHFSVHKLRRQLHPDHHWLKMSWRSICFIAMLLLKTLKWDNYPPEQLSEKWEK